MTILYVCSAQMSCAISKHCTIWRLRSQDCAGSANFRNALSSSWLLLRSLLSLAVLVYGSHEKSMKILTKPLCTGAYMAKLTMGIISFRAANALFKTQLTYMYVRD